ncbi:MAG: FAD-dependent oxidoreductase [Mycobacteriales bacterium]
MAAEAVVIGRGVSGLSTGIQLLEAGVGTEIVSRGPAADSVSHVAAAFWYPYRVYPEHLISQWAQTTYRELWRLSDVPGSGVRIRPSLEVFAEPQPDPWWSFITASFRHATARELPDDYGNGYLFDCPVAEMPVYLPYLQQRFTELGGTLRQQSLNTIDELRGTARIVVNCAGLGARELVGDATLTPVRGQIVRVSQVGIERLLIDQHNPDGLTYIVPRSADCILGGTAEIGDENLDPDPATASAIIARCVRHEPRLADATVLEHRVGLRPGRPGVRVELIRPSQRPCWCTTMATVGRALRSRGAAPTKWCGS